jgi:hypothetical protein
LAALAGRDLQSRQLNSRARRRFALLVIWFLPVFCFVARAGTYTLVDGTQVTGDPISYNEQGVALKSGEEYPPRIAWSKFTQDSLKQLRDEAKSPKDRAILDPMLENSASEKAKRKAIVVKPVETPERPTAKDGTLGVAAIFSSPLGLAILLVLYAANLFAAYEVAVFRRQPFATVGGLAAIPILGIASPIVFIALPSRFEPNPEQMTAAASTEPIDMGTGAPTADNVSAALKDVPPAGPAARSGPEVVASSAPAIPPPVTFRRGEFSFNRRFFETKLAGFFRLVPAESEKDLLVLVKSSRGDFIGKRITKVTPAELYLQVFKNDVTADEMIPFIEINEVQIRHKDLA